MNIKNICQLVYDKYNVKGGDDVEFSLPYIYQHFDKEYVSFFLYEMNDDNWPKLEIANFSKVILVDYNAGEIKEINDLKSEFFGIKPQYNIDYSEFLKESDNPNIADIDYIQNNYYKLLDEYFGGKVVINEYIDMVCNILPKDFREVYNDFGGKFFNLSLYSKK